MKNNTLHNGILIETLYKTCLLAVPYKKSEICSNLKTDVFLENKTITQYISEIKHLTKNDSQATYMFKAFKL